MKGVVPGVTSQFKMGGKIRKSTIDCFTLPYAIQKTYFFWGGGVGGYQNYIENVMHWF